MKRTTISLSEAVKKELLREMAKLQLKWGRKVDFEDVIIHLLLQSRRRPELLEEACKPVEGIHPEVVLKDLTEERRADLKRENRKTRQKRVLKGQNNL
ncbi:MAG: hypothetical protein ACTSP1_17965 [Candidatus Freyarchaeota archaeon]